jgi:hypothetical protein
MSDPLVTDDVLLIDRKELARRLSVSLSTLHAMRRSGKLPLTIVRLAGAVRYDAREVVAWVAAGCPAADRWKYLQSNVNARRAG